MKGLSMSLMDQIREAYASGIEGAAGCVRKKADAQKYASENAPLEHRALHSFATTILENLANDLNELAKMQRLPAPKA